MIHASSATGVAEKDIRIITNFHGGRKTTVPVKNRLSESVKIRRPCIHLYSKCTHIFRKTLKNIKYGVKVISNIRYAEDIKLIVDNLEGLQELTNSEQNPYRKDDRWHPELMTQRKSKKKIKSFILLVQCAC